MIVRATLASSPSEADSSTACASSIPVVPTITAGMPRAVNRRMSAPHGTPASSTSRPSSSRRAPRTVATHGWSGAVWPGANAPPSQTSTHGASPSSSVRSTTACSSARASARSAPTGTPSRPSNSTRSGTWLDQSPPATLPISSG